jgi:IS5 family transposase
MLRTINAEPTLWDAILPECCLGLPPGLAEVDRLLDDVRFFEPFVAFFSARTGRPSIPMETYLRMMFLRFRYKLGFETLCAEVADSIAWRRFCRIPLDRAVPHPTTLLKITARCLDAVRADTTVVEANVAYPTDSGLLAKGVARMAVLAAKIKAAGLARRTGFRDRTRSVRRRAHDVAAWLRRRNDDAKEEVLVITGELAAIAVATVVEARAVAVNARRTLARRGVAAGGKLAAMISALEDTAAAVEQIAAQTRARVAGEIPDGATRVVSLHDLDARPIRKGRLGRPVEFGYKAQVADNADGVVVDHVVVKGNPPDGPMLVPAVTRITARFGRAPRAVTADRGYGEARIDTELESLGVKVVAIPRRGRPGPARSKVQRGRRFTKLVKWRTGSEARISCLKRDFGWRRSLFDGLGGTQTWCGWGVLAHNSIKIAALADIAAAAPATPAPPRSARTTPGTDPPTPISASRTAP